jgi:hypothetical protein
MGHEEDVPPLLWPTAGRASLIKLPSPSGPVCANRGRQGQRGGAGARPAAARSVAALI